MSRRRGAHVLGCELNFGPRVVETAQVLCFERRLSLNRSARTVPRRDAGDHQHRDGLVKCPQGEVVVLVVQKKVGVEVAQRTGLRKI